MKKIIKKQLRDAKTDSFLVRKKFEFFSVLHGIKGLGRKANKTRKTSTIVFITQIPCFMTSCALTGIRRLLVNRSVTNQTHCQKPNPH